MTVESTPKEAGDGPVSEDRNTTATTANPTRNQPEPVPTESSGPATAHMSTVDLASTGTELRKGEYYRLNTTTVGTTVELEVVSVNDGVATVEITGTSPNGDQSTTTVRGDTTSVMEQIADSQLGFGFLLLARAPLAVVENRDLTVGDEFTVDSTDVTVGGQTPESGTFSITVTGTESVSGIDCTTVDITLDGRDRQTACVNRGLLFALQMTIYNDEGESTGTIFIEEYRVGTRANDTDKG